MSTKSPFIRAAPLQFEDLPPHPSFPAPSTKQSQNPRPDLLTFALTALDQGRSLLLPTTFNLAFKHHSNKSSPPSNNEVEILSAEVPTSTLSKSIPWSSTTVPRPKPSKLHDEFWYARRSYHHNLSVKRNAPGTASFNEFIYGLRDKKSEREAQFTSDLYDAHYICDWNDELSSRLTSANSDATQHRDLKYTHATMSIYEMCHKLPSPASPRCFPVLVMTASVSPDEFIAVTLPVDITHFEKAFYSNGRNQREGTSSQSRKSVTLGTYVAVERVCKYIEEHEHPHVHAHARAQGTDGSDAAAAAAAAGSASKGSEKPVNERKPGDSGEQIEWVMATASRAKGNIPMAMQRMGVPGAIAKDVGLFLKWIHDVPEGEVSVQNEGHGNGQHVET